MSKILKVVGASWLQTKISSYILGILGTMSILALFLGQIERIREDGNYSATVFYNDKTGYNIEYWGQSNNLADIPKGVARAHFRMDIDTRGWSLLEIETDGEYPDEIQAYAAGIVEGALTWYLIHLHLENTIRAKCDGKPLEKQCDKLKDSLEMSANIWKGHAADHDSVDPFWHHVSLHYVQISGIYTGWKYGVERNEYLYETDVSDLYWLNAYGEVAEIQHKLNISLEDEGLYSLPGVSSAFLKYINETNEDGDSSKKVIVAQNAAGSYSSMTRILKRYKLNYHQTSRQDEKIPAPTVEFTSFPGSVTSQDEFYILRGDNHSMAVTGTTLRNYNSNLWREVNITGKVPLGPRVSAANHLATNVSSWAHILARSNSGTGGKQWLVVDFTMLDKKTTKTMDALENRRDIVTESTMQNGVKHTIMHRNDPRAKGLALLVEQVPGRTHSADITDVLRDVGYFATHGLPFFGDIANTTNVTEMHKFYGNIFSENDSPRARVFREHHKNATSVSKVIKLMRSNNLTSGNSTVNKSIPCWKNDCILSEETFLSVVGIRGDIARKHNKPFGIIDTKVICGSSLNGNLEFIAISSPPYTEVSKLNASLVNKGNIVPIYTNQFDNEPTINGVEIRDLVKHQIEEKEQEKIELYERNTLLPFQWSESEFSNYKHNGLPDKWDFGPFTPAWSW